MNEPTRIITMERKLILLACAIGAAATLRAQDGHISQYETSPALLNPALTGMYANADFRMATNVRSQWNSLSSSFTTMSFGYDVAMQGRYGFGTYLNNYNMAGIVNTFQWGASAAYNVSDKDARHILSAGVNLGLLYKKMNDQQLIWDAQYDNGYFNTDLPSGENFMKGARLMPEVALGISYRSVTDRRRVNPFANVALFHVTTPDESIMRSTKSDLPIRYSVNAGARVEIAESTYLTPMGLYMRQGADQQINAGMMAEMGLGGSVYSVLGGLSYRLNDAVIACVGMKHKNAYYRFSYDVNVSSLQNYTRRNGAFEFALVYYGMHSGRDRRVTSSTF